MDNESESSVIDLVEDYLEVSGWNFQRNADDLITYQYVGEWSTYKFAVAERQASVSLEAVVQCQFDFAIQQKSARGKKVSIKKTINRLRAVFDLIHGHGSKGTFHSIVTNEREVTIVWTCRFRMSEVGDILTLESVMDEARIEVDEYYPVFRAVLSGEYDPQQAIDTAIPAAYGRA